MIFFDDHAPDEPEGSDISAREAEVGRATADAHASDAAIADGRISVEKLPAQSYIGLRKCVTTSADVAICHGTAAREATIGSRTAAAEVNVEVATAGPLIRWPQILVKA